MKLKLKHLRHPLQTVRTAKALAAKHLNERMLAYRGKHRFGRDPRYNLQSVTDGFASHINDLSDDREILERICTSYVRTIEQQQFVSEIFKPTRWWEVMQHANLQPTMRALATRDIDALRGMYQNFFRDPCSAGLIGVAGGLSRAYFNGSIKDIHRRFFLADALYRIEYWTERTNGSFALHSLSGPDIGNPFGVLIDGTLVRTGAEYQHDCAQRVSGLIESQNAIVAEIGGGFGGMAYYLLRDRKDITYIDFDVPESIALTSYYLLKAFPQLTFLLYGEQELTQETIARADVVLMPPYELEKMPACSVDITFSSHAISDLSETAMAGYLNHMAHMTRNAFLYIGTRQAAQSIGSLIKQNHLPCILAESRSSDWNAHRNLGASEIECLYRIYGIRSGPPQTNSCQEHIEKILSNTLRTSHL